MILQLHGGDQRSGVRRVFRYLYLAFIFHTAHAAPTPGGDKLGVLRLFGYLYSAFILHTSPKPLVLTGDQVYDACSGICIAPSYFILIIQPEPFGGDQQSGVRRLFRYLQCAFIFHTLIVQPQPLYKGTTLVWVSALRLHISHCDVAAPTPWWRPTRCTVLALAVFCWTTCSVGARRPVLPSVAARATTTTTAGTPRT